MIIKCEVDGVVVNAREAFNAFKILMKDRKNITDKTVLEVRFVQIIRDLRSNSYEKKNDLKLG